MSGASAMPARIGRFHVRSMLGRGAMGVVYLGHDEEIDRLVAIKLIRADLLDTEERDSYLKRFRNEAKIAGRCMHANIVGLYDFAMHDDNPYLVMEYVNGVGLQQFFPRGSQRPVDEVIHIALQVLDALNYAHHRGIVHRDIKPANILMSPDRALKITDFGISRLTSMELTATPLLIGTPSYMSPEQCIGSALDGRNDLFSLGCVLYELLAGERAFSGVNYTESIFAIVNKPHAPLDRYRDDLPPGFATAIDCALAKKPDERFPDAASFARTLDEIARKAGVTRANIPQVIIDTVGAIRSSPGGPHGAPDDPAAADAGADDDHVPGTIVAPFDEPPATSPETRSSPAAAAPPPAVGPTVAPPPVAPMPVAPLPAATPSVAPPERGPAAVASAPFDLDPDATLIQPRVARPPPVAPVDPPAAREIVPDAAPAPGPAPPPPHVSTTAAEPDPTLEFAPAPAPHPVAAAVPPAPPPRTADAAFVPPRPRTGPPLDPAERAHIAFCLADVLGPIAPILVRRAEAPNMSAARLIDELAAFIRHGHERTRFLALVDRRRPAIAGAGPRG